MSRSPKTSGAPQMHAVQLDLDEKPGPNEPPPPTGTQVTDRHWYPPPAGRSLGNAFFHVLAWASGYAAAQFWYEWTGQVVLVSTSDEMLGDFATLDAAGHWTGTFSSVETTHAVAALVGTNVLFAVIAYLLLKFQVWAHTKKEGSALLQMMLVGFTRVIDAHVDGATFFSTNMLFVVLVSAFSWGAPMLPRLLGFSVGLTLVLLLLTLLSEQIPRWLHESGLLGSSKQYSAAAQHTTEVVNDWFIGQWQWLLGFAWWNSWLVLLTSDYLDVFHYRSAWWALCGVLFLLFVLVAIVLPALAPSLIELKRTVATHPSTRARRLLPMLIKSFRWVLAIGLFFTLRRQFAVFDQGLSLKDVSLMDLGGYCVAVSAASVFGVFLLETILRGTEQLRWLTGCVSEGFCLGRGDGAPGATPHEHSQGCTQAYQGYLTRVAAACPSRCVFWRREQLQACLLLILYGDSLDSMFRLLLSYLAGTAWRAFGFAAHHGRLHSTSDFLWVAVQGSLVAAVLSMVGAGWTLKTERKHGEAHSVRCVCPICAPEHYEQHVVEETEQHATGLHGQEVQHAEYRYVPVEPRLGFAVGAEIEMVEMDLEDELKEKLEGEEPAVERYELTI